MAKEKLEKTREYAQGLGIRSACTMSLSDLERKIQLAKAEKKIEEQRAYHQRKAENRIGAQKAYAERIGVSGVEDMDERQLNEAICQKKAKNRIGAQRRNAKMIGVSGVEYMDERQLNEATRQRKAEKKIEEEKLDEDRRKIDAKEAPKYTCKSCGNDSRRLQYTGGDGVFGEPCKTCGHASYSGW